MGTYLAELGFNLDFAPSADLSVVDGNAAGSSSYGSEADNVASFVGYMQAGLQEQKVTACIGQFPGIGSSTRARRTAWHLQTEVRKISEPMNLQYSRAVLIPVRPNDHRQQYGSTFPDRRQYSLLPVRCGGNGYLRNELNFRGVIVSGAMNEAAISNYYGADEAAVLALRAGCDMIYAPENFETAYNGVLEAVQNGTISEERINDSLRRIYRIKYADKLEQ